MSVTLPAPTAIVLDEHPLSLLTMRVGHPKREPCKNWFLAMEKAGHVFHVPAIADYELRRELLRTGKEASIARLDAFNEAVRGRYLPLTQAEIREAARLWAIARDPKNNRGGAPKEALDGDVLIAAQAKLLVPEDFFMDVVVATSNPSHLSILVTAYQWDQILP